MSNIFVYSGPSYSDTVYGTSSADSILSRRPNASIYGYGGDDTVEITAVQENYIEAGNGNDSVKVWDGGDYVTVLGGPGNDTIWLKSTRSYINGGIGNDVLWVDNLSSAIDRVTLTGGSGNDIFEIDRHNKTANLNGSNNRPINLIITDLSDSETIRNINSTDIELEISESGGNVVLTENGYSPLNITLQGVSDVSQVSNVVYRVKGDSKTLGEIFSTPDPTPTVQPEPVTPTPTIQPDPVTPNPTVPSNNVYSYSSGNKTIDNYQEGEVIRLDDYQGLDDISNNSFYIKSKSGRLDIQNCHGKWIGYSAGNSEVIAYSHVASGSGTVDGRSKSQAEILIGANNSNNSIVSGAGDSSLWGGNGGNDTLVGGDGYNEYFYTIGNGNDVIQGAQSKDLVNLLGVSFDQITGYSAGDNSISLQFNDGGSLRVEGYRLIDFLIGGQKYWHTTYTDRWVKS